jgi:hypothetical protein
MARKFPPTPLRYAWGSAAEAALKKPRPTAAAVAIALLVALAAAGCGLGAGSDLGDVSIRVTRDFGAENLVKPAGEGVTEADTVMRVLERDAEIETSYGGGFVQSIEGLEAQESGDHGPEDWFFYVNGVESAVGAAEYGLNGGEAIWWDYHRWRRAMRVPAVVGSWPQPFAGGYEGDRHPVAVLCRDAGESVCDVVRGRLEDEGVAPAGAGAEDAIRVLVGPWQRLRRDPAAAQIDRGPPASGVFAAFESNTAGGCLVQGLDEDGALARVFGADAGLVAATRRYEAPPTWVVTGCDRAGVGAAARLLDPADLDGRFAVAAEAGAEPVPLPLPGR